VWRLTIGSMYSDSEYEGNIRDSRAVKSRKTKPKKGHKKVLSLAAQREGGFRPRYNM
jgi:hypothetical protein